MFNKKLVGIDFIGMVFSFTLVQNNKASSPIRLNNATITYERYYEKEL